MMWFAQYGNKSQPYTSLHEALSSWGISGYFGRRVESGVYEIYSAGKLVLMIRQDKLQKYSKFLCEAEPLR